jgi:L-lactate dehydrogenase complex protein LldG
MSEREKILERIREALRNPAQPPHSDAPKNHGAGVPPHPLKQPREWLPIVGPRIEDQMQVFARNATDLKAAFSQVAGPEELTGKLVELKNTEAWKKVGSHRGELTGLACGALGLPVLYTDSGYQAQALESCDVGITECDALVAQTGSVLLTSVSAGGRALSVLPPHHVVIATVAQMVPDLPEAFALLRRKYEKNYPSFISFVTGPSRTGDIERILVLGAHGPKKLTIFCLQD